MKHIKKHMAILPAILFAACGSSPGTPSKTAIDALQLKKGEIVVCGTPDKEFGVVNFDITGSEQVKVDFNTAVELLHSFEYDEAEKTFAKIIDEAPDCAMAYWGVAMCSYHPLWEPPTPADLEKGAKAVSIAKSIKSTPEKEAGYINAIAAYYTDWEHADAHTRSVHFEKAMGQLHNQYPADKEAAIFYALALDASALPTDKTYAQQKKAGHMLDSMYTAAPNHPGIIHYIIHTYDYPGIAALALPAARRYAEVAPSSAHALHMPSHIFTRLGLWDESIKLNTRSVEAAQCYAQAAGIKGHWDEELHGIDYLVYAYLQKGDNKSAAKELQYLATITAVSPVNFKEAYTFAASPTRFALENKDWAAACKLSLQPASFPWAKFPWQEAIIHFGRLLGFAHTGNLPAAAIELARMDKLYNALLQQKDAYKANQVAIQIIAGKAWIALVKHADKDALSFAKQAADMEDSTNKHPVTPGEVLPARELYADLLLVLHQNKAAYQQYVAVLQKSPNRFNSLYGAGRAAELVGDKVNAAAYYKQLKEVAAEGSEREEVKHK